jgi:hypothetical protein
MEETKEEFSKAEEIVLIFITGISVGFLVGGGIVFWGGFMCYYCFGSAIFILIYNTYTYWIPRNREKNSRDK